MIVKIHSWCVSNISGSRGSFACSIQCSSHRKARGNTLLIVLTGSHCFHRACPRSIVSNHGILEGPARAVFQTSARYIPYVISSWQFFCSLLVHGGIPKLLNHVHDKNARAIQSNMNHPDSRYEYAPTCPVARVHSESDSSLCLFSCTTGGALISHPIPLAKVPTAAFLNWSLFLTVSALGPPLVSAT